MLDTEPDRRSLLSGLEPDEHDALFAGLTHRSFPAGAVLIAQGDRPGLIYLVRSGSAEVVTADGAGREHRLTSVGPGGTIGEMSYLTGEPAGGTVRAATDVEAAVLTEADLDRLATGFPHIYRNLSTLLAERLARVTRRAVGRATSPLTVLLDDGAPPLLGYALASSIAWHARSPTLLIVLADEHAPELVALAEAAAHRPDATEGEARAHLVLAAPRGRFAPDALRTTVEDFFRGYGHVLVQAPAASPPEFATARTVQLAGRAARRPATGGARFVLDGWVGPSGLRGPDRDGVVGVPAPAPADVDALRRGLLGAGSPFAEPIGWAARDLARLKVGLALGAGSQKGYAHIGVIDALARAGVTPDYVAGTSIGAAVAGMQARGHSAQEMADILDTFGSAFRFALPTKGLMSAVAFRRMLKLLGRDTRIEDLPVPLALVAADLNGAREVVFRSGLLWLGVLSSTAIPGMYPAQKVGPYLLVDGGVLNPVPVDVVSDMGADAVIGVRLGTPIGPVEAAVEAADADGPSPSVVSVIRRSIDLMQVKISQSAVSAATVSLEPQLPELPGGRSTRLRRFTDGRRYIEHGEAAVADSLPRLAATFPWVRA